MTSLYAHIEDKEHVIWDWNGTLLNDVDHAVKVVCRILEEESLPSIDVQQYKSVFRFPVIEYYRHLGFDTSPKKFADLCERFNQYFYEELHTCALWPGARETLAQIHKSGKTQSLLSASEHNMLQSSVRQFDVDSYFHHVFGIADKMAASKVSRGHELIEQVRSPLSKTVLIGDTDHDLEVGKALGIDVILVEHGHQCPTRLKSLHNRVVKII